MFFVLKYLHYPKTGQKYDFSGFDYDQVQIIQYFESHSGKVEVVFKDKIFECYHLVHPIFQYLDETLKTEVLDSIDRDVPKKKMKDFLQKMPTVFDIISFKSTLSKSIFSNGLFILIGRLTFACCLVINLLIITLFKKTVVKGGDAITDPYFDEDNFILNLIALVHLVLGGMKLFVWLMSGGRIEIMKEWRKIFEDVSKKMKKHDKYKDDEVSLELTSKKITDLSFG